MTISITVFLLIACDNDSDSPGIFRNYNEFLSDKTVIDIEIVDGDVWILSAKVCDTCNASPISSSIPFIYQLTRIDDQAFQYTELTSITTSLHEYNDGIYARSGNSIVKIKGINSYETVLDIEEFSFVDFDFTSDGNIWLSGYDGIAYWDGSTLDIYRENNSALTTNITHGLAVGDDDNVWVCLDFQGLMMISDGSWTHVPVQGIPFIESSVILYEPIIDSKGSLWLKSTNSRDLANILSYDGTNWENHFGTESQFGYVFLDAEDIVWAYNRTYDANNFISHSLHYYDNGSWIVQDISMIESYITTMNADANYLYLGTNQGLITLAR